LIPEDAIRIFPSLNTSGCTLSLSIDLASNRNYYREHLLFGQGGRCVRLTTLPPSCADGLEILGSCPGLYSHSFTFTLQVHSTLCLPFRPSSRQLCQDLYFLSYNKYIMNSSELCVLCNSLHNSAQPVAVPC